MTASASNPGAQPVETSRVVEHLFRHEAAKMVATLTKIFGLDHLALAEDVVQEALARALRLWPFHGIPKNPSAWIMQTSRNLALDVVRRQKIFRDKEAEIVSRMESAGSSAQPSAFAEQEIADDRLRMMFVCCHPVIPIDAQVALALKTLCGFSIGEISRAFLTTDAAIAKRLTRAKQKIRDARLRFELPSGKELERRLDAVLKALYLLFNEGYKASSGPRLVREDVCREAMRLTGMLAEHPIGNQPKTHALLALMLLTAARGPGRVDGKGNLLRLQDQDRGRWDPALMGRGMVHFARSAAGEELTEYHLQAGIAACHCAAADFNSTDWPRILELYDKLLEFDSSPVIALNRAVAIAQVHGPQAAIAAVNAIPDKKPLESYYLLYAVLGDFEARRSNFKSAAAYFRHSLDLAQLESERHFLSRRIQNCRESAQACV